MTFVIAVDFDGTIVEHQFPKIGMQLPGAIEWLKRWHEAGAKLILNTMRSGAFLDAAVSYLDNLGVTLWGVNNNPEQHRWTSSPKVYANIYVDDLAFGCPLRPLVSCDGFDARYAAVDWDLVGPAVLTMIETEKQKQAELLAATKVAE